MSFDIARDNAFLISDVITRVFQMKTVAEYRQFAEWCREMATKITDSKDKHAVELMAKAWETVAQQREAALHRGDEPIPGPGIVPPIADGT